jgi:hypothetical protein
MGTFQNELAAAVGGEPIARHDRIDLERGERPDVPRRGGPLRGNLRKARADEVRSVRDAHARYPGRWGGTHAARFKGRVLIVEPTGRVREYGCANESEGPQSAKRAAPRARNLDRELTTHLPSPGDAPRSRAPAAPRAPTGRPGQRRREPPREQPRPPPLLPPPPRGSSPSFGTGRTFLRSGAGSARGNERFFRPFEAGARRASAAGGRRHAGRRPNGTPSEASQWPSPSTRVSVDPRTSAPKSRCRCARCIGPARRLWSSAFDDPHRCRSPRRHAVGIGSTTTAV